MKKYKSSGPNDSAFPFVGDPGNPAPGMTAREYYAAQAMIGILGNSSLPDILRAGFQPAKMAEVAFLFADAMLDEAKKTRRAAK